MVVKPELGPHGICSTIGKEEAGLVVVARSCMLAAAAATAARAILARRSLPEVLAYLQAIDGVHGALVVRGQDIGLAGGLELAA